MVTASCFGVDIDATRRKLAQAGEQSCRMGEVWRYLRRCVYDNPDATPWMSPFVGIIERDERIIDSAKRAIRTYLDRAEQYGNVLYLFNIWCFAFPHARWALWFDLMRREGLYESGEAEVLAARFLLIQFRDNHAGMLVKPYPECVDNQAASLALSSYFVGTLFADMDGGKHLAGFMADEAAGRLEGMLGGMPPSGYSEEGSTYHSRIVSFTVPFLMEAIEQRHGQSMFFEPLAPNGVSAYDILRMTARITMPSGILLPWDDYGYQLGQRLSLAYLAHRVRDSKDGTYLGEENRYLEMLEHVAPWSGSVCDHVGWGFDEPIWTLVYWPLSEAAVSPPVWQSWSSGTIGGAVVNADGSRYLMQMWDPTQSMCMRAQVNPNSLVLEADGIPLTADGTPVNDRVLVYEGASWDRSFGSGAAQHVNLSKGCAGSHNTILVDGNEGMRPHGEYPHSTLIADGTAADRIAGDVTGLYQHVYPDCQRVVRHSRLISDRFWLVDDIADFDQPHRLTSRWWFRPGVELVDGGVDLKTPEGLLLQMRALVGPSVATLRRVDGFPKVPDGCSDRVDYEIEGVAARWLWLLWPVQTRRVVQRLDAGWLAVPCRPDIPPAEAEALALEQGRCLQPGKMPWWQADVPLSEAYAFTCEFSAPEAANWMIRLPRGMQGECVCRLDGREVVIDAAARMRAELLPVDLLPPAGTGSGLHRLTLVIRYHIGQNREPAAACWPEGFVELVTKDENAARLAEWRYADGNVEVVTTSGERYKTAYNFAEGTR